METENDVGSEGVDRNLGNRWENLIQRFVENPQANNLFLFSGTVPKIRVMEKVVDMADEQPIKESDIYAIMETSLRQSNVSHHSLLPHSSMQAGGYDCIPQGAKNIDLSLQVGNNGCRLRINVFYQKRSVAMVMRKITSEVPSFTELGINEEIKSAITARDGIIFFAGPANSGKTTTMGACVDYLNKTFHYHIVTIEDPIEYLHHPKLSLVTQREVGIDVISFHDGLKDALRQNPDVIAIGEIRDAETLSAALKAAETGHLILTTIHASSIPDVIARITGLTSSDDSALTRNRLASALRYVMWQRLIPISKKTEKGEADGAESLQIIYENLMATVAVKNLIRRSKENQLNNEILIQGGRLFSEHIKRLLLTKVLKEDIARQYMDDNI